MSEALHDSPLDIVRSIESAVLAYDNTMLDESTEADNLVASANTVKTLAQDHPYLGQQVKIYGQPLTFGLSDESGQQPLVAATNHEYHVPTGIYQGMTVRPVYYPALDYEVATVVHMLASNEIQTHTYFDDFWNFVEERYTDMTYVPVAWSDVEPEITYNMHSLNDLQTDAVLTKIKQLIGMPEAGYPICQPGIIRGIGGIANTHMRHYEFDDPLKRQRVSYLNALNLFKHLNVTTADFVLLKQDKFEVEINDGAVISTLKNAMTFQPKRLEIASGLTRFTGGNVLPGGPPEVFAVGNVTHLGESSSLFAPLKSVVRTGLVAKQAD